MKFNKDFH